MNRGLPRSIVADDTSSRSTSAVSSRGVSEAQSSNSGASDTTDAAPIRRVATNTAPAHTTAVALEAASAQCSMCDEAISSLLCTQCGRLSFCVPCCISLHDNKFLASHKLLSLEPQREGETVSVGQLKERIQKKNTPSIHPTEAPIDQRPAQQVQGQASVTASFVTANKEDEEWNIDMASLAADRNIIHARLSELASCRSLLQSSSDSLSKERFRCKDICHTATEAIRQRFDVLRDVVNKKEAEYIASVEQAAKSRLEDATKASFEASASLTECDAFLDQTKLQLERLATSKKLFAEARASMLSATDVKLRAVDDTIQRLQNDFDRIASTSLGITISLERAIDEVMALKVPRTLIPSHHVEVHSQPIPAERFTMSPGVKVVRQRSTERETAATTASVDIPPVTRKSYLQEIDVLRNTPLKEMRMQQGPANGKATMEPPVQRKESRAGNTSSPHRSSISRIADKYTANPIGGRSMMVPKELESLRQVVANSALSVVHRKTSAAPTSSSRGRSPIAAPRAESPSGLVTSRRASPMRHTQLTPYRNAISPSRGNPDATPGPGAYYKPTDFASRSMLSTPPRRR